MIRDLNERLAKLESHLGDVMFRLDDGSEGGIPRKHMLAATVNPEARMEPYMAQKAYILLHARAASDESRLHELAQALAAGPVPPDDPDETYEQP